MILYHNDNEYEINQLPFVSRNTKRKISLSGIQTAKEIEKLNNKYKDVVEYFKATQSNDETLALELMANVDLQKNILEYSEKVHDAKSRLSYRNVIISTLISKVPEELRLFFVDYEKLNKEQKEQYLDFWDNQNELELNTFVQQFSY